MGGPLLVRGAPSLARNFTLLLWRHRGKPATLPALAGVACLIKIVHFAPSLGMSPRLQAPDDVTASDPAPPGGPGPGLVAVRPSGGQGHRLDRRRRRSSRSVGGRKTSSHLLHWTASPAALVSNGMPQLWRPARCHSPQIVVYLQDAGASVSLADQDEGNRYTLARCDVGVGYLTVPLC